MKEERRNTLNLLIIIGLALLMAIPVYSVISAAQPQGTGVSHETTTPNYIKINGYTTDVNSLAGIPDNLKIDHYLTGEGHYVLKFDGPVRNEWKTAVERAGGHIIAPLGGSEFLVEIADSHLNAVKSVPHVSAVAIDQPAFRLSRALQNAQGPVKVKIFAFPGYENSVAANLARLFSGSNKAWITSTTPSGKIAMNEIPIINKNYGMLTATVDSSMLDKIARINGVAYIEQSHENYVFNDEDHSQTQHTHTDTTSVGAPNNLAAGQSDATHTPVWNHGIYGTGIIIGETDTAVGLHHDMFRDLNNPLHLSDLSTSASHPDAYMPNQRKVIMYATYASTGYDHNFSDDSPDHGSHVAGTILGYDNPDGGSSAYDGMAPGAKLSFGDIDKPEGGNSGHGSTDYLNPPNNFKEMWDPLMTGNLSSVKICSHSWGGHVQDSNGNNVEQSEYMDENVQIDQYQWENDKVFTWAAGNEGNSAHTLGIQAESKNTVTVAAADRTDKMASFSSVGPTYDGRLKPDVTMAGTGINSVDAKSGDSSYTSADGTSMATPGTAGSLGLIQEYFQTGWYPSGTKVSGHELNCSAALLKADLINGAEEMTDSSATNDKYNGDDGYPSADQGWGFINVDKSLYFSDDTRDVRVWDNQFGASTGDQFNLTFEVSGTTDPLTVTLVWTDPPAAMGASTALVNDLDLTVIDSNGNTYKGNVFKGTNPGYTPANSGSYDHLNNVEEVKVVSGHGLSTGIYTVRITGYNIPSDPQKFALVVSGDLNMNRGIVYLDNKVYCQNSVPQIRVEDADGGSAAVVNVTSALTGDYELVSCSGGDSLYLGQIPLTLDAPVANDGKLSVTNGDTITASYEGATFKAKVDAKDAVISNVHAQDVTNSMATITFDADKSVLGAVSYGTDPNNMVQTDFTSEYSTSPAITLTGLSDNTLYYYDVIAKDKCGHQTIDNNGGDHYRFTTTPKGDILVVVSDNSGYDWQQLVKEYKDALTDTGWSYNLWYSWDEGNPSLATLQEYKAVLWQVGIEHYPPFDANERALVKNYLDGGGRMWVNSQDVAWDFGDSGTPAQDYSTETHNWLVAEMKEDWKKDPTDITTLDGISGDPISGAYTGGINYDEYRSGGAGDEVSSKASGGTTTYVWTDTSDNCAVKWISSADNGTAGTGVWGGTPSRIQVNNLEWTSIDTRSNVHSSIRSDIINKTIVWLIDHAHPDVSVTNPTSGSTVTSSPVNIQWTKSTYGGTGVYQTKLYYSDNGGDAWYLIDTVGDVTSYSWDISSLQNGAKYNVKVVVYDDSSAHLAGSGESGIFTIDVPGQDTEGPVVVSGTQSAEPIPVNYGDTIWFNATIDDSDHGNSNIYDAEYFVDSVGANGTGTAMNPVDGSFDSPTEKVTWSGVCNWGNGNHTLYIHGRDDPKNWGSFATVTFHVNGAPKGVHTYGDSGWNLISFPWMNTPTSITDALSGWNWDRAMVYDNQNKVWYTYNTNRDSKYNLGFPQIDNTMGIWVEMSAHGDKSGIGSGTTNITLYTGWNLVGYPSSTAQTVSDALNGIPYDIVQTYDNSTGNIEPLNSGDYMNPGQAYWIHVTADATWSVDW